jgi:phosphoribosylanthranilate isomerase
MEIKICGITRIEDAVVAVETGATMIGFVLAQSPRRVDAVGVREMLNGLSWRGLRERVKAVGVFVNESPGAVGEIVRESGLDFAQIHGDETVDECNTIEVPWFKGLRVDDTFDEDVFRDTVARLRCDTILIDAKVEGMYGGSGKMVDRRVAHACANMVRLAGKKFFIAGGVTPENVCSIIEEFSPDGIDLSSALETAPGIKSHEKIRLLLDAIAKKCG